MSTWRAKLSEFFQKWRYARYQAKAARDQLLDERQAAELERARKGVNRFPPAGSA
jgi:hypothetical protein